MRYLHPWISIVQGVYHCFSRCFSRPWRTRDDSNRCDTPHPSSDLRMREAGLGSAFAEKSHCIPSSFECEYHLNIPKMMWIPRGWLSLGVGPNPSELKKKLLEVASPRGNSGFLPGEALRVDHHNSHVTLPLRILHVQVHTERWNCWLYMSWNLQIKHSYHEVL